MTTEDSLTDHKPEPVRRRRAVAVANPDDQALQKANEAIAIRPKRGRLTLLSRRIYNVLLYHAQKQGVDQPSYTINLAELIDDARFTSHNTELLKSHIRDMQATTIEWHTSVGGARAWTSTQLLGTVVIDEPGRGQACTITWTYPEAVRERLVQPNHYTWILMEVSSQMRSHAASVLFELGLRYLTSPGRLTMREDLLWWASVLTGRSDISKVDYRILHRDTIKKALAEVDALNEQFRMEVIEHKRGRKVEEIQFRVVPKVQQSLDGINASAKNIFNLELVDRLVTLGFKKPDAQDFYATTDEGVLRAAIEHTEQRLKSSTLPALKSPAAYVRDAVKKEYAGSAGSASEAVPREEKKAAGSVDERLDQLREELAQALAGEARSLFAEMGERDRQAHIDKFEEVRLEDLPSPIARAWRKDGTASRIASSAFFRWLSAELWPESMTDAKLLQFAMTRGQ